MVVDKTRHPVRNQGGLAHPARGDEDQDAGVSIRPGRIQDSALRLAPDQFLETAGDAQIQQSGRGNPLGPGGRGWRVGPWLVRLGPAGPLEQGFGCLGRQLRRLAGLWPLMARTVQELAQQELVSLLSIEQEMVISREFQWNMSPVRGIEEDRKDAIVVQFLLVE